MVCPLCYKPLRTRTCEYLMYYLWLVDLLSSEDPAFGAACRFNQKERKSIPRLSYNEPEQVVPTMMPAPINHHWIRPFPHDNTIDHIVYQQLQLIEDVSS